MELEEKSACLIRAEEKVKLANDELEKVKKEEKNEKGAGCTQVYDGRYCGKVLSKMLQF